MKKTCLAVAVLATLVACSGGETPGKATNAPAAQPPKDFRKTLLSEATRIGHGVALSGDGKRALISSVEEATDPPHGSVTLWNLADPLRPRSTPLIPDRGGTALKVALSGDGKHAATFNPNGKVTLWDLADLARPRPRTFATEGINSLALNHDGRYVITGGRNGVYFWDLTNPARPRKDRLLASGTYTNDAFEVALSADAKRALVSVQQGNGEGGVTLWNLSKPTEPEEYVLLRNVDHHSANTVALSGDGNYALVGFHHWVTYNNFLTYWDLRTWDKSELRPMTGWKIMPDTLGSVLRWEVALSRDGKRMLTAQYNDIPDPADPRPPRADVRLWALDSLNGFRRFQLAG